MNLYTLSKEMQEIINLGYDDETTQELLEGYNIIGQEQIEDIVKTIRTLEAEIVGYNYEIERLTKNKKGKQMTIDSLEGLVDIFMKTTNQEKLDTNIAKVFYRKSESVSVLDENLLSDEYMRVKTIKDPDKTKIKEDIKKGIIVEGATITTNYNLQIK